MSTAAHHDSLPEHPDSDLIDYRPVSGWAVAAVLLGLASILALVHPLLWCVPMAGLTVSLIALRRIDRPEVRLLGRKAALVGLAFSVIYGVAAPVRLVSHNLWLKTRAERLGDDFVDALKAHKIDDAFAMTLQSAEKAASRKPAHAGSNEQVEPETQSPRDFFLSQRPVDMLLKLGPSARVERFSTQIQPSTDDIHQPVAVYYRIIDPAKQSPEPVEFVLQIEQITDGQGIERWWISRMAASAKPDLSV